MVRVDRLRIGGVYKNYKEVCAVLGEKVTSSRAKKIQLAKWGEQFSWVMQRYEWRIVKIHPNPEAEVEGLTTAAAVGLGIVSFLLEEVEMGEKIEIVNENEMRIYSELGDRKKAVSVVMCEDKMMGIIGMVNLFFKSQQFQPKNTVWDKEFFGDTRKIVKSFMRYSIRGLEDQRIVKADLTYQLTTTTEGLRVATLIEHTLISDVYVEVLNDFQRENLQEVKAINKLKEFYKRVNNILLEKYSISFHKSIWLMTTSQSLLDGYLERLQISDKGIKASKKIINRKNVIRLAKHFEKVYIEYLITKDTFNSAMTLKALRELPEEYLSDNIKRIENFVQLEEK